MKEIGGYFELEFNKNLEYHVDAIKLNTARNALEYILRSRKYNKLFIPFYTCDVILEPIKKLKVEFEFYKIDKNLEPVFDFIIIKENDGFLYTNYFGLKDGFITKLSKFCKNLIIDNAQSFFSKPIENVDTFYSARKFFGVSDGAYLYSKVLELVDFKQDESFNRMSHLLIRKELSAEAGYGFFLENDKSLKNNNIKLMSKLTSAILGALDYQSIIQKRIENYKYLNSKLKNKNLFNFELSNNSVPMVYPFWSKDNSIKNKLIANQIFCATYWPNVLLWCKVNDFETKLTNEVVYLPIDQRYDQKDMDIIINLINNG